MKFLWLEGCDVERPALYHSPGKTWFDCNTRNPHVIVSRGSGCAIVTVNVSQWYAGWVEDIFEGNIAWSSCSVPWPQPLHAGFWVSPGPLRPGHTQGVPMREGALTSATSPSLQACVARQISTEFRFINKTECKKIFQQVHGHKMSPEINQLCSFNWRTKWEVYRRSDI